MRPFSTGRFGYLSTSVLRAMLRALPSLRIFRPFRRAIVAELRARDLELLLPELAERCGGHACRPVEGVQ